jgi:lipid-binding SYLF domain-containing protein
LRGLSETIVRLKKIIMVLRRAQKRFDMNLRITSATRYSLALTIMALIFSSLTWAADNETDIGKRIDTSAHVLNEIMATPDKAIPDGIMHEAKCIAVIPSMVKVAFVLGGNHGKGVATCRTEHGWSAPAPLTITGGSWGLQLGAQATDLVLVVMTDAGMEHLLSSHFKLGADISAAAGPVGRDATAGTDIKMRAEVLTYSRTRGLFAGIDLSGAAISQDKDETQILFGQMVPFQDILRGQVAPPAGSEPFLAAVRRYSMQAKDQAANTH